MTASIVEIKQRPADGHKGTFGHALIIAGKYGMAGASILAAQSCLRSGVGKVTVCCPKKNNDILQISVPEAILLHDPSDTCYTTPINTDCYDAIAIGPGLGTEPQTAKALETQLQMCTAPLVIDADALNIISLHPEMQRFIPAGTILTPHEGELHRLKDANIDLSPFIVVHKGHPTKIGDWQCPYGNDGMATAGSGDVLTGIICGLLAQGYSPLSAAQLGVTLHALAGDIAAEELGHHSLIASDIITHLPQAFKGLSLSPHREKADKVD